MCKVNLGSDKIPHGLPDFSEDPERTQRVPLVRNGESGGIIATRQCLRHCPSQDYLSHHNAILSG